MGGRNDENDYSTRGFGNGKAKYDFERYKTIVTSSSNRWPKVFEQTQAKFDNTIIEKIIMCGEFNQIILWTQVSKSTGNFIHGSQSSWKDLFRKRHWNLPHEIRNKNFSFADDKPIPQLKISDKQVDWFNEYKRNYITCASIRKATK